MKKYMPYWPIFALIIFLTGASIWYRPLSLHQILRISKNEAITDFKLILTQWGKNNVTTKEGKLTSEEAKKLMSVLAESEYIRFYGNEAYTTSEGEYYTIDLAYTLENEEEIYRISITKHGVLTDYTDGNRKVYTFEEEEERTKILNQILDIINTKV